MNTAFAPVTERIACANALALGSAQRQEVPTEEPDAVWQAVESIKVGEYVRRSPTAHRTFTRGKYDPVERRYPLHDCEDINRCVYVRKGTNLVVDFTY